MSATIPWVDVEALLIAVGCRVVEGRGSRVRFEKDDVVLTIHRPDPAKEARRYHIRDVRVLLTRLGVEP